MSCLCEQPLRALKDAALCATCGLRILAAEREPIREIDASRLMARGYANAMINGREMMQAQFAQQAATQAQMAGAQANRGTGLPYSERVAVYEALEAARKRVEELEALAESRLRLVNTIGDARDELVQRGETRETLYGIVRNERDDLLRENAVLRRRLETAERKAVKR